MTILQIRTCLDKIECMTDKKARAKHLGRLGFKILCDYMKRLSAETKADIFEELCDELEFDQFEIW